MANSTEVISIYAEDFTARYRSFIVALCCSTISTIVNLSALCSVTRAKGFLSNYTLIYLYISSFPIIIVILLTNLEKVNVVQLKGEWLCGLWSGFRRLSLSILPVTVVAISVDRLKSKSGQSKRTWKKITCAIKVFALTWIVACLLSFPVLFTYKYVKINSTNGHAGKHYCKKILLLRSKWVGVLYEGIYSVTLHVFPSCYMIYDFRRLKFKLTYLFCFKRIPTGLESKIHRLRLVFFYAASFIAVWLPFGILVFVRKLLEDIDNPKPGLESKVVLVLYFLVVIHLVCHPLFYIYTHHRLSICNLINVCSCLNRLCARKEPLQNGHVNNMSSFGLRMETYNETKINMRF